jgi:hypothetical protein
LSDKVAAAKAKALEKRAQRLVHEKIADEKLSD